MRSLALAILAIGAASMGPAAAQTYDPAYPVCLHKYGPATYYECRYTSLPECNASAAGRATCGGDYSSEGTGWATGRERGSRATSSLRKQGPITTGSNCYSR